MNTQTQGTTAPRLTNSNVESATADWRHAAACRTEDPDLFSPDDNAPQAQIDKARAICAGCPVKQQCLDEAFKTGDRFSICGGLTPDERDRKLTPQGKVEYFQARRAEARAARELAMTRGADLLTLLAKRKMHVDEVADRLETTPRAVFHAWLMLVPAPEERDTVQSSVQRVLTESSLTMRALERSGRSHEQIAKIVGTSQNVVSACLRVLAQRDEALERLSRKGIEHAVRMLQEQETRVRRESRSGLTVQDIVDVYGYQIVRMHQVDGKTLRQAAVELGLCRETVRKAYKEFTTTRHVRVLTKTEMESAA